jgi:hypothetical protein
MNFADMNPLQRRMHNAAIVLECDGDETGFAPLLREAIEALTPPATIAVGVIEKSELDSPEYGLRLWHSIHNDWDTAQQEINETVMELQDAGVTPIPHLVAVKLTAVPDA